MGRPDNTYDPALSVDAEAVGLAQVHREVRRASRGRRDRFSLPRFGADFERIYNELAKNGVDDPARQRSSEWFLDNYYIVRRVARQVDHDLPPGFARRLPRLVSGPDRGLPRIDAVARELVEREELELHRSTLSSFLDAYQEVVPLSIAELWALPTMLRVSVLRTLRASFSSGPEPVVGPDLSESVERAFRELRLLEEIDWEVFFEEHSAIEKVLRGDPSGVYPEMDFDTCDDYRKAVEELAWSAEVAEKEVATLAVEHARKTVDEPRRGHVGFYLVAEGRGALEAEIGYRPRGVERVRRFARRYPTASYLVPVSALTLGPVLMLAWYGATTSGSALLRATLVLASLLVLPALWSAVAAIVHVFFARLLHPRRLPKLDYESGIPEEARTLVVIPTLLAGEEDFRSLIRQLELHYLSNPDPMLGFALLTDHLDADEMTVDEGLVERAAEGIDALNARHGDGEAGPFLLLHRELIWNPAEERYMGWERKRGKLEELNRMLRGDRETTFVRVVGDRSRLEDVRFVITLDSDTELPLGAAQRMAGLLAHPLNHAVFDDESDRVVAGYTVVQPRLETSPTSAVTTRFARIFGGEVGLDIYTHASSELYQDLFGAGIYCGKGIYDVDAFTRSLEGRIPENAIVSHDLFEGVQGRAALASDIVLFEHYPSHYATYSRRLHRWVRGDWQLWPWLFPWVPMANEGRARNRLPLIDRWKMVDNMRRSLVAPTTALVLVACWTVVPLNPVWSTLVVLGVLLVPIAPALAGPRGRREALGRAALTVVFLVHEASVVVDAIARVLVRTIFTHKNLLEWTSAAHSAQHFASRSLRVALWREMNVSPIFAVGIALLVAWLRPAALPVALPLLLLWAFAPEIARWVSTPLQPRREPIRAVDEKRLRLLARRTWLFFETFVGPLDQWLPIDNYQEAPREQTAHRTSPTNIGMMLLSTLAAYDFGYIGPSEMALRLRRTFDTIGRLTRYRGHLLNWYATKSLEPLLPRYVSTVDSGNLAGCLLALKKGCRDAAREHVVTREGWPGLADSLALVEESLARLERRVDDSELSAESEAAARALRAVIERMHGVIEEGRGATMINAYAGLVTLCDETSAELKRVLLALVQAGVYQGEADDLHTLRTSMGSLEQHLDRMRRETDSLIPWLALSSEPAARGIELSEHLRLSDVAAEAWRLRAELEVWEAEQRSRGAFSDELEDSADRLRQAFDRGAESAEAVRAELLSLADLAEREAYAMDFGLLFDRERKLFHIGYQVSADRADPHHYDLLASEARLASYFAIIKQDVPESHWYALGRPVARAGGGPTLLSWGGTMFEYLMPSLLMRSRSGTLLDQSVAYAVDAQISYGAKLRVPWGISESAYARTDSHRTYQYQSFGVPELGLKRDLEDDLVVAPYASLLAISVRPRAVADNVRALESMGMCGTYGMYEAIDFHPEPGPGALTKSYSVVRSYMSHHQGMSLVALDNFLNAQVMVRRFHAEPAVGAAEMLLNELTPTAPPPDWRERMTPHESRLMAPKLPASHPWSPEGRGRPQAFVFGNRRLSTILTERGGGGLRWQGLALTRYQPEPTGDGDGIWLYLREPERGTTWRATSLRGRTTYSEYRAEFHQRDHGISVHVAVTIAPADDVELRRVTLHNESGRSRRFSVTSAGEPLLLDLVDAQSHPAFARMFIESSYVGELDALVFTRRPRAQKEGRAVLVHRLVCEGDGVRFGGYQTDRSEFFGRGRDAGAPRWLEEHPRHGRGRVGTVIDPVMSLTSHIDLGSDDSVTFAFVTTVARSRSAAIALARKYGTMHAVQWAFRDARRESPGRMARAGVNPELLPAFQRLFSALSFVDPTFRPARAIDSDNGQVPRPRKDALWGQGISGDLPIVVLQVGDPDATVLDELVLAQRYLRSCGVGFDLVMLDEEPSGYLQHGIGSLHRAVSKMRLSGWMNRRGGVHLVSVDKLDPLETERLIATARVYLDTRGGPLGDQMTRQASTAPPLPRFEPSLVRPPIPPRQPPREPLHFDNGRGGFSEDGREYVISVDRDHPTPAPWCNVLANPHFGCLASESSLGSTWAENAGENRLTPWRNDPVFDTPSEVLYLRDEEDAAIWSTTPRPAGGDVVTRVRHGAGYTTYERHCHGLEQDLTIFVPVDSPLKVVRLRVKNTLAHRRRLTATYYAEWVLGSVREEQRPHISAELERPSACLLARCDWIGEFAGRVAFLASELDLHGFTTDRSEFLGSGGDYARPEALTRWGLNSRLEDCADPCAAVQVHLELDPAEQGRDTIVTHFVLGEASSRAEALKLVERYRLPDAVDQALDEVGAFWDEILGSIRVKTPEPAMDLLLNRWLLYQSLSSRVFGRTAFFQSSGAFGFRDQLQDVLALVHMAPERARAHILEAAAHQFEEGDVLHWWHPPSGRGVRTRCSDDLVWLPYVAASYVAATGDSSIWAERVPFLIGEPLGRDEHDRYAEFSTSQEVASLLDHCRRALERAHTSGFHGLPLMGDGDWNDGMNRVGDKGRGESVWLGWFLCATMNSFADVCEGLASKTAEAAFDGEGAVADQVGPDEAAAWRARSESIRAAIEESAWDGEWYIRAFHDDGSVLGSREQAECTIDSIAQSWAVLSGVGDEERARLALRSADQRLVDEDDRLVLLLTPPFDVTPHNPGYIRSYPPGVRENGGQYTHAATWLGWAHAALGDGESAARIFRIINPILRARNVADTERYRAEPYVLTGDVYSSPPWVGRGGWSWYTGAAAWAYRLGVEAILGLRREAGHLSIDPCIPPDWDSFEAWVRVGAGEVHIVVDNPDAVSRGIANITLDGATLDSNAIVIDPDAAQRRYEVRVRLGEADARLDLKQRRI